jgi:hypothetical protein
MESTIKITVKELMDIKNTYNIIDTMLAIKLLIGADSMDNLDILSVDSDSINSDVLIIKTRVNGK